MAKVKANTTSKTATPGTADADGKKVKHPSRKPIHPLVGNKDETVYPFNKMPEDFDHSVHSPLKKKDFKDEADFYDFTADKHEVTAKKLRVKAEQTRQFGSAKDRRAAKQLVRMREKMIELTKALKADGVDVDALLNIGQDEATEAPAS